MNCQKCVHYKGIDSEDESMYRCRYEKHYLVYKCQWPEVCEHWIQKGSLDDIVGVNGD